ncbi:short tail fiber protein [Pectobacterium phage POP12]|nr:short tail fiber protein [Pectobacterium phage POP12]
MNNTINHISDKAIYVKFDPTGTQWPSTVLNVQQALADIAPYARQSIGLPSATEAVSGVAMIATEADIDAGLDNTKIVTPKLLAYRLGNPRATQTIWGYTRYATDAELGNITNDSVSVTPRGLDWIFNNRLATEDSRGSAKISTTLQATAGTDNTTVMTPLKVKQAISALVPVQADATESNSGLVRLATIAQVRAGTIRDGFAISPYTFNRLNATETDLGILRIATNGQVSAGVDDSTAITPLKLQNLKANTTNFGIVRLSQTTGNIANTALAANANVVSTDKSSVVNAGAEIYHGSATEQNRYITKRDLTSNFGIGDIWTSARQTDRENAYICDGRGLNTTEFAELFSVIGYTFGGEGSTFNIPDMRGEFVRGHDRGKGVDVGRSFGSKQTDAMQPITGEFVVDDMTIAELINPSDPNDKRRRYPNGCFIFRNYTRGFGYDAKSDRPWEAPLITFDSSLQTRTASETRPRNIALNYLILVK